MNSFATSGQLLLDIFCLLRYSRSDADVNVRSQSHDQWQRQQWCHAAAESRSHGNVTWLNPAFLGNK